MNNIKKYGLFLFILLFFILAVTTSINAQSINQSNQIVTMSPTPLPSNDVAFENTVDTLLELAKSNIERSNLWFTWMLRLAGIILTIITMLLAFIGYLVWKHMGQAKQAEDILTELEKRRKQFDESGQFIADLVLKQKAMRQRATKLNKSEISERAKKSRGFSPILYKAAEEKAVYAIDEYGHKHWIPNPPTLMRMGYSWSDVKQISKDELKKIPTGENIPDLTT